MAVEIPTPDVGAETVSVPEIDAKFRIGCAFHRGEHVVDTETREDPATGKPRKRSWIDEHGQRQETDALFPIYSEKIGHQDDCVACDETLFETKMHIRQVESDRERARREFEQLRARMDG